MRSREGCSFQAHHTNSLTATVYDLFYVTGLWGAVERGLPSAE